jgi:hypothetical protein
MHSDSCPVPLSKRQSLYYNTCSTVMPYAYCAALQPDCNVLLLIQTHRIPRWIPSHTPMQRHMITVSNHCTVVAVCPFRHKVWRSRLVNYVPHDPAYTAEVLVAGIQHGCYMRYEGTDMKQLRGTTRNHPMAELHSEDTLKLILNEVSEGRIIGPFTPHPPPLPNTMISPLSLVPKGTGWRLINDLSSPRHHSVNDGINHMVTPWQTIGHALSLIIATGPGCHLLRTDVKGAYRNIPIHPSDWHLFACQLDGMLFYDTFMPFGCRSSGNIWERYAQAMQWMLLHCYSIPECSRWVDDFLFVLDPNSSQQNTLDVKAAFADLGVPLDNNKQGGPTTCLDYIGFSLDTRLLTVSIAGKHRAKLDTTLTHAIQARALNLDQLQSLIGKLEFICTPIRPGRSRMYHLRRTLYRALHDQQHTRLTPPLFMAYLRAGAKTELRWWLHAIHAQYSSSMLWHVPWPPDVAIYEVATDASEWGCGAYSRHDHQHISVQWSPCITTVAGIGTTHRNMPMCEAMAVALSLSTWCHGWAGQRVRLSCDCIPVVFGCNHGRAGTLADVWLNAIYSLINDLCHEHRIDLRLVHISGLQNVCPDLLSRNQVDIFQHTLLSEGHSLASSPARLLPATIRVEQPRQSCTFPEL